MGPLWLLGAFALMLCVRGHGTLMNMEAIINNRTSKQIATVVTGLPILQIREYGLLDFFRNEVVKHRILVFKNQGKISAKDQKKIALYFGDRLDDSHPQHPAATEKEVILVSNDKNYGLTNVGSRGWHMDGYFFEKPHSHCVYHMTSVAKKGPTMFIPLDHIVDALNPETKARWDRIWIRCRIKGHIIHPLIYHHAVTGNKTMCIHTDFIDEIIWDHGSAEERVGTEEEKAVLVKEINDEFNKQDGYWHYLHNWEEGDVIVTDNLSAGHQAHPDTQLPSSDIGVRVLQRACVLGKHVPAKTLGPTSLTLENGERSSLDEDNEAVIYDDDRKTGQTLKLVDMKLTENGERITKNIVDFAHDTDIAADDSKVLIKNGNIVPKKKQTKTDENPSEEINSDIAQSATRVKKGIRDNAKSTEEEEDEDQRVKVETDNVKRACDEYENQCMNEQKNYVSNNGKCVSDRDKNDSKEEKCDSDQRKFDEDRIAHNHVDDEF